MTEYFYQKLLHQISSFPEKKIILVTHQEFIIPLPNKIWEFLNAYLGSTENVKYVLFGHVHYRKDLTEKGRHYICSCLSYRSQWPTNKSTLKEIRETLKIIEL